MSLHERGALDRPRIALTMGDPAGVGPDILAGAIASGELFDLCNPVIVGDPESLREALKLRGRTLAIQLWEEQDVLEAASTGVLVLRPGSTTRLGPFAMGRPQAACGDAAFRWIRAAVELAMSKRVAAVVTGPISKQALLMAGHDFPGHTEIVAHFTGARQVRLMLADGPRRVVHVTCHQSVAMAVASIDTAGILETITLGDLACRRLGITSPRLAVAALNPHAGEAGRFGDEEARLIEPALASARSMELDVTGPLPPDTAFIRAFSGEFDLAVAMYHDQGHIPFKLAAFQAANGRMTAVRGVNITLGLPIVRTSVDHGTAWDLAGKGVALHGSLLDAVEMAVRLAASDPSSVPAAENPASGGDREKPKDHR